MIHAARLLVAIAGIAVLTWAATAAVRAARAEETLADVDHILRLMKPAAALPQREWSAHVRKVDIAAELDPNNPAHHELRGLLSLRRTDAYDVLKEGAGHFARALSLRPVSAATWANLAEARYAIGDVGPAFQQALAAAFRLGPAQPQVQRMVVFYGLAVWDEVAEDTRRVVDAALAAGMRRNSLEMLQIAERRDRLPIACRHLEGSPRQPDHKWPQLCQSTEASR